MVLPQSARRNPMTFRGLKNRVFLIEGLNGFATSLYFNYLFFYLTAHFGMSSAGNLFFCAANGFVYMFASLFGGRWAQKHGYFNSLRLGFITVICGITLSAFATHPWMLMIFMLTWTIGICFTWPVLEALTSEHETSRTLPGKIGCYNIVWSATQALAYFSGGAIIEKFGYKSIFAIPVAIHAAQLVILTQLARVKDLAQLPGAPHEDAGPVRHEASAETNRRFLRMAWLANPFAYIAMNTVIPLVPDLAKRLHLSPMWAGFFASTWMFARLISFGALWRWTGWHYRFRWLASAYAGLIVSFASLLLLSNLVVLIFVQLLLGWCTGLIYYSSLFYSMDASDTKGEHGGIHEAAIGFGIFGGPAIGVAALYFFPGVANSSVWAVSAALSLGFGGLFFLRNPRPR
jgi:MFS family permease